MESNKVYKRLKDLQPEQLIKIAMEITDKIDSKDEKKKVLDALIHAYKIVNHEDIIKLNTSDHIKSTFKGLQEGLKISLCLALLPCTPGFSKKTKSHQIDNVISTFIYFWPFLLVSAPVTLPKKISQEIKESLNTIKQHKKYQAMLKKEKTKHKFMQTEKGKLLCKYFEEHSKKNNKTSLIDPAKVKKDVNNVINGAIKSIKKIFEK